MKMWVPSIPIHRGNCYVCGDIHTETVHLIDIKELEDAINCADDTSLAEMYQSVDLCPWCKTGLAAAEIGDDNEIDCFIEPFGAHELRRFEHLCTIKMFIHARAKCAIERRLDNWNEKERT